jgi:hypothetical protein
MPHRSVPSASGLVLTDYASTERRLVNPAALERSRFAADAARGLYEGD